MKCKENTFYYIENANYTTTSKINVLQKITATKSK